MPWKGEREACKNVYPFNPGRNLIGDYLYRPLVAMVPRSQQTEIEHRPYLCGTVRTHSSNAPIGDSAPTTSCYMTGQPSRTGYVSTYPENDGDNDIYPTDPARAFQPLTTVLEAGKMLQGKATGLVFTCEFPHATPADCSAHSYNRGKYDWIAPQMVHNDIDVVIGGGVSILTKDMEDYLLANGYNVYKNDLKGMRADNIRRCGLYMATRKWLTISTAIRKSNLLSRK